MARYIDTEKAKTFFEEIDAGSRAHITLLTPYEFAEYLDEIPAADVQEVRHAYWKETTHITESKRGREIHSKLYNCSNCDAPNGRKKSSYCHWCGAKMDGERGRR